MEDNQDSDDDSDDEAIVRASITTTQRAIPELMMDKDEGFLDEDGGFLDEDEDDSSTTPFERHIRRYQHTARPREEKKRLPESRSSVHWIQLQIHVQDLAD